MGMSGHATDKVPARSAVGRKTVRTAETDAALARLLAAGKSYYEAGDALGVSHQVARIWAGELGLESATAKRFDKKTKHWVAPAASARTWNGGGPGQARSATVCSVRIPGEGRVAIGCGQAKALATRIRVMRRDGLADGAIAERLNIEAGSIPSVLRATTHELGPAPPPAREARSGTSRRREASAPQDEEKVRNLTKSGKGDRPPAAAGARAPNSGAGLDRKNRAALERIAPLAFAGKRGAPALTASAGKRPYLAEIPLERLRVETAYQRVIGKRGAANVKAIVEDFRWSRFAPLIVAPIDDDSCETERSEARASARPKARASQDAQRAGGLYAIIDGQHRATALACLGVKTAPAIVHDIDLQARADAFAAINVAVTAMTPQARYHAMLGAGAASAVKVDEIARRCGVEILAYSAGKKAMSARQCVCAGALLSSLDRHGAAALEKALTVIVSRRNYRPGDIDARVVAGLSAALAKTAAARLPAIIARAEKIDFEAEYARAVTRGRETGVYGKAAFIGFLKQAFEEAAA